MVFSGRKMQSNEIIGDVQQSERNNWEIHIPLFIVY